MNKLMFELCSWVSNIISRSIVNGNARDEEVHLFEIDDAFERENNSEN